MKVPSSNAAFSLVELMAVMAIMSILAGVAAYSLSTVNGVNLKGAGNTVADTINLARQNSISQNAFTALVVQKTGAGAYNTYCLIQLLRDPVTGAFSNSNWQALTAWRHLSNGLIFDPTPTVTGAAGTELEFFASNPTAVADLQQARAPLTISYQGQALNLTSTLCAAVFRPDGTMDEPSPLRLRLVRGVSNAGIVSYLGPKSGGVPDNYYDILFLPDTGQTKIKLP